ncbi:glycosyltransferase family 4 protein [Agromyces laixinhei]|uniref:rhamnosyltransferase WsaF family glycosyltransferase n=1 Tax=Agromyces laixinhei TaxID=2585717 RepID=UPI001115EF0C|nr:glycosyltransferase family 4 protein [Agromyces laixinhei]
MTGRLSTAMQGIRQNGIRSTAWRGAKWLAGRVNPFQVAPLSSVYADDLVAVDWSQPAAFNAHEASRPASGYRVAWLISPPGRTSGGHQNAFRFMSFLEQAGNPTTVFLYSPAKYPAVSVDGVKQMMAETSAYPEIRGDFRVYDPDRGVEGEFDVIVACDWETTYAAHRYRGTAKRFYFTQDFEPAFFPWGSDYAAAENSYRLGFHGFSAGRWLAEKLTADYGMSGDHYDYAVDTSRYHHVNTSLRNEVLFYARPPTPRRATEFGLLALRELHRRRPDVTIHLVGWDMSGYDVPFPFVNHSAVDIAELNAIYNRCAAGLILSLTNMSLLPIEVMGAGVVPIVNDAPNTRGVLDSPHIEFTPMAPAALADRMVAVLDRPDQAAHAEKIARSVAETDWSDPGADFVAAFDRAMQTAL